MAWPRRGASVTRLAAVPSAAASPAARAGLGNPTASVLAREALSWIDESTAQAEIGGDEYALLTEVPGDKALPGAQPFAPAAR